MWHIEVTLKSRLISHKFSPQILYNILQLRKKGAAAYLLIWPIWATRGDKKKGQRVTLLGALDVKVLQHISKTIWNSSIKWWCWTWSRCTFFTDSAAASGTGSVLHFLWINGENQRLRRKTGKVKNVEAIVIIFLLSPHPHMAEFMCFCKLILHITASFCPQAKVM